MQVNFNASALTSATRIYRSCYTFTIEHEAVREHYHPFTLAEYRGPSTWLGQVLFVMETHAWKGQLFSSIFNAHQRLTPFCWRWWQQTNSFQHAIDSLALECSWNGARQVRVPV